MDVSPLEAPTSVGKKFPFPVGKGQGERNCLQGVYASDGKERQTGNASFR